MTRGPDITTTRQARRHALACQGQGPASGPSHRLQKDFLKDALAQKMPGLA